MADFVKKIEKERARLLVADERVLAASMIQPKGAFKKQAIAGGIGGALGALAAQKLTANAGTGAAGLASAMPAVRGVAALTDQRLVVVALGSMMNSLKDVVAAWPRTDVASVTIADSGKLVNVLAFAFVDGSVVEMECVRAGNPRAIVDALAAPGLQVVR